MNWAGKLIVELQTSLALVSASSTAGSSGSPQPDQYGRIPFKHPALEGLDSLTEHGKTTALEKIRVAGLAESYGLDAVLRWKPKKVRNYSVLQVHTKMLTSLASR